MQWRHIRASFCALGIVIIVVLSPGVFAQDDPDIVIRYEVGKKITEYRRNGEILEIKVEPENGPVYFLVPNPDGELVYSETSRLYLPTWKILQW